MKRALVVAVLGALAAGCPPRPPLDRRVTYRTIDRAALMQSYNANASRIASVSADLRMTVHYNEEGRDKKRAVSARFNAEKPGRFRLKHDAIGRDLFYVLSDGGDFWIALDRAISGEEEDVVYTGKLSALEDDYYFLRPDQLLDIFALPALPPAGAARLVFEEHPGRYVFNFVDSSDPPRLVARAVFSRVDLLLSGYQLFDEAGRVMFEVEYERYKTLPQGHVPDVARINWPFDEISFDVRLNRISLEPVPPALWKYRWREDVKTIPVEAGQPQTP